MRDFARAQVRRQRLNFALFLGPASCCCSCFFVAPVIVDIGIAFSDMDRTLKVTRFTMENFQRMLRATAGCSPVRMTPIYVVATLAIFNVTFGLLLALVTTAVPKGPAASSAPSGCCRA